MIPQGSIVFNTEIFDAIEARIAAAATPAQLQVIVDDAMASLSAVKAAIASQLAALEALEALLTIPAANPAEIVTWITKLVEGLIAPYLSPTITLAAQLAQMVEKVAHLASAIEARAAHFPGVTITIPAL